MKRKILRNLFLFTVAIFSGGTLYSQVESEYCYEEMNTLANGNPNQNPFLASWNTEANGDITFTIMPLPGQEGTFFRNNGWSDPRVQALTVDMDGDGEVGEGETNAENIYFTRTINAEKTVITLVKNPDAVIPDGATIRIDQELEYLTATAVNLYPAIVFEFTYGATCEELDVTPLATPEDINIDETRTITFTGDEDAGSNELVVYREESNLPVHTQNVQSGDVINFNTPGQYSVTIKSISNNVIYSNSEVSKRYEWKTGELESQEAGHSEYCSYLIGTDDEKAYLTWETDEGGNIVISIAGFFADEGEAITAFRGNGINVANFKINGNAGTWFNSVKSGDEKTITLTPNVPLYVGDKIVYNGVIEYRTPTKNPWPTLPFEYTYGNTCAGAPEVSTSKAAIAFSPTVGEQTFTVSGANLTEGELTLTASRGLSVTPATITIEDGTVTDATVTVTWEEGSSEGFVRITGGGLRAPKEVSVTTDGFSEYCNKVIRMDNGNYPAYLTVIPSPDKTSLTFEIAPYAEGETTTWNGNSIEAANILVNGNAPEVAPVRTPDGGGISEITITFNEPLADGDVVSFGAPLTWTIAGGTNPGINYFLNPLQTYTVGLSCNLAAVPPTVTEVGQAEDITTTSAQVTVTATAGDNEVAYIRFKEDNGKVADITLAKTGDDVYELIGLTSNTDYSFEVTALDEFGNASAPYATKLTFTTLPAGPEVASVVLGTVSYNNAQATVTVTEGDFDVVSILFVENGGQVENITLAKAADDLYTLRGLTAETPYSFSVYAIDSEDNESEAFAAALDFTTTGTPDITFPVVASVGEAADITASGAAVSVTVTAGSNPVASIRFEDNTKTPNVIIILPKADDDVYTLTGLEANTEYSFSVYATDEDGYDSEEAFATTLDFTTAANLPQIASVGEAADITASGATVTVEVTEGTYPVASIRFEEVNDKVADIVLEKTVDNSYAITGLDAGTEYAFNVYAIDSEGNESEAFATALEFTTGIGFIAPAIASVGEAMSITSNSAVVTIIVTNGTYDIEQLKFEEENGLVEDILLDKTNDDAYFIDGLSANTSYSFVVSAIDAEGNESEPSASKLAFTTTTVTAIDGNNEVSFSIYPIPAQEQITIDGIGIPAEARITDMQGKLILKAANTKTVNVSDLNAGLYLISVTDNNGNIFSGKIVIK